MTRPILSDAPVIEPPVKLAAPTRGMFGESAIWSEADRGVWWIDMHGHAVVFSGENGRSRLWKTPQPELPNARATVLRAAGGILVALNDRLAAFDPVSGDYDPVDFPVSLPEGHYFNDACVDPHGRLIIGTMAPGRGNDGNALIYQLGPQSTLRTVAKDMNSTNGLAFAPDGRTIYFSDSWQGVRKVWRASYDAHAGRMGAPELFVDFTGLGGRPDGATVDAQGGYWVVGMGTPYLHRFAPDGALTLSVKLPVDTPTRPTFGGAGLKTMYLTTGGLKGGEFDDGLKGGLLTFDVGYAGLQPWKAVL